MILRSDAVLLTCHGKSTYLSYQDRLLQNSDDDITSMVVLSLGVDHYQEHNSDKDVSDHDFWIFRGVQAVLRQSKMISLRLIIFRSTGSHVSCQLEMGVNAVVGNTR